MCCLTFVFSFLDHFFVFSKTKTHKIKLKEPLHVKTRMSIIPNPEMKTLKLKYGLFRLTQEHHKKCLRDLFLKYYEPLVKDYKPNNHWTLHVPANVMRDLRLHLSWTRGGDVTHWTDEQIGKKIVGLYHKTNVLPFLMSEIRRRK